MTSLCIRLVPVMVMAPIFFSISTASESIYPFSRTLYPNSICKTLARTTSMRIVLFIFLVEPPSEDIDACEMILDEVLDPILETGRAIFREAASRNISTCEPNKQDLHSLLHPLTVTFGLKTISGKISIAPVHGRETYTDLEPTPNRVIEQDLETDGSLPQYLSKNVFVLETFEHGVGSIIGRVLVEGKEMICRAQKDGLLDSALANELMALHKIRDACQSGRCRAPMHVTELMGHVRHDGTGHITGLLREWVLGHSLSEIDIATTPAGRRQKWASQIGQTVEQLHEIDVVWGNAKASNVIVDDEDETWLIDFGGGWTEGWVDEKLAGTVDGDEQAVQNILNFPDVAKMGLLLYSAEPQGKTDREAAAAHPHGCDNIAIILLPPNLPCRLYDPVRKMLDQLDDIRAQHEGPNGRSRGRWSQNGESMAGLLEWTTESPSAFREYLTAVEERIPTSGDRAEEVHTLRISGLYARGPRTALCYVCPEATTDLRAVLLKVARPSGTDCRALARVIATQVRSLHVHFQVSHTGLRAESFVFLGARRVDLARPYLLDWARPAAPGMHRHPRYEAARPAWYYQVWALLMVLSEIAEWRPLEQAFTSEAELEERQMARKRFVTGPEWKGAVAGQVFRYGFEFIEGEREVLETYSRWRIKRFYDKLCELLESSPPE
ncbi:hypothetical protein F4802DRAFT_616362 [Xylaria palmicola]|nr:hypothetical protein F4802DRAFT_616362 [Xylaria palmicola]